MARAMSIVEIDLDALAEVVAENCEALSERYHSNPIEHPTLDKPELICEQLNRYVEIIRHLDAQQHGKTQPQSATADSDASEDMDTLSNYGMQLLQKLHEWSELLQDQEQQNNIDELSIPFALWAARNKGKLQELQLVVNSLSQIANHSNDTGFLKELSGIMNEIANAAAPEIKDDSDKSNPGRPWRVLNLNHAIVATRSHDTKVMEQVFEQILVRLPDDAANFFKEGMEQMDVIGYPTHVRHVMEKYFQLTNNPTLH